MKLILTILLLFCLAAVVKTAYGINKIPNNHKYGVTLVEISNGSIGFCTVQDHGAIK